MQETFNKYVDVNNAKERQALYAGNVQQVCGCEQCGGGVGCPQVHPPDPQSIHAQHHTEVYCQPSAHRLARGESIAANLLMLLIHYMCFYITCDGNATTLKVTLKQSAFANARWG